MTRYSCFSCHPWENISEAVISQGAGGGSGCSPVRVMEVPGAEDVKPGRAELCFRTAGHWVLSLTVAGRGHTLS